MTARLTLITLFAFLVHMTSHGPALADFFPDPSPSIPVPASRSGTRNDSAAKLRFFNLIDRIERDFTPDIAARGYTLRIERLWSDPRVNAQITRDDENNPVIRVYGGLGRHPMLTDDAFLLILCHELGHYLGGAPKALRGNSGKKSWSSTEGQADYFASSKCMKRLISQETREETPESERRDPNLRIKSAGEAAAGMFAEISGKSRPSLLKSDPTIVEETLSAHPTPQCRLDTFVAGARCGAPATTGFDDLDPEIGACKASEGQVPGARPLCWYAPE